MERHDGQMMTQFRHVSGSFLPQRFEQKHCFITIIVQLGTIKIYVNYKIRINNTFSAFIHVGQCYFSITEILL